MKHSISFLLAAILAFGMSASVWAADYGQDTDNNVPNIPSAGSGTSQSSPTPVVTEKAVEKALAKENPVVFVSGAATASKEVMNSISNATSTVTIKAKDYTIQIDPKSVTSAQNVSFQAKTSDPASEKTFEKFFDNNIATVSMTQQGSFGATIEITIKPASIQKLDLTKELLVYSYDKKTNSFIALPAGSCKVDAKGNLIIKTSIGGQLIVTDKPLTSKAPKAE